MAKNTLNAVNLKEALWQTLNEVRDGGMDPAKADAIAGQAREIIRTSRLQLSIARAAQVDVPDELVGFANPARHGVK